MAHKITKNWRDAATLIIAARNSKYFHRFKILMVKRSNKSKFMPNTCVFPGGVISEADFSSDWCQIVPSNWCKFQKTKLQPFLYSNNRYHNISPEFAFRLCALRETFEESGLLITLNEGGEQLTFDNPDITIGGEFKRLGHWRDKVNLDAKYFLQLFHETKICPNVKGLHEWSTWLTPTVMKTRFDTMFFVCFVDEILTQSADKAEVSHSDWFDPNEVLQMHFKKTIELPAPQIYELFRIRRYGTYHSFMKFVKEREKEGLQTFCAERYNAEDGFIFAYLGDDYHVNDWNKHTEDIPLKLKDLSQDKTNRIEISKANGGMVTRNNVEFCGHPPLGYIENLT